MSHKERLLNAQIVAVRTRELSIYSLLYNPRRMFHASVVRRPCSVRGGSKVILVNVIGQIVLWH